MMLLPGVPLLHHTLGGFLGPRAAPEAVKRRVSSCSRQQ
jgi:hypothetical protein